MKFYILIFVTLCNLCVAIVAINLESMTHRHHEIMDEKHKQFINVVKNYEDIDRLKQKILQFLAGSRSVDATSESATVTLSRSVLWVSLSNTIALIYFFSVSRRASVIIK